MATEVQDILKTNLVLIGIGLLNDPDQVRAFQNEVDTEVIVTAGFSVNLASQGNPIPTQTTSLDRDRITIESTSDRTIITREYPSPTDLDRLSEITSFAIRHTDSVEDSMTAFGCNLELVYEQASASTSLQYLRERLFGETSIDVDGWNLTGGSGKLMFDSDDGRWTVQLEPRFNNQETSKVFMSVNLHLVDPGIPSVEELKRFLDLGWDRSHKFVVRLDEGSS